MNNWRWFASALTASALATFPVAAQTVLTPDSYLSQDAGCFLQRCFIGVDSFEGNVAVTTNTGPGVAVHTPSSSLAWTIEQVLTNPDYSVPPSPYSDQSFGGAAQDGSALLIGGTSRRYNFKDVVYVYAPVGGEWAHVQTLALQRPADYDRTHLHRIATDGTTAIVAGTRVKDAIDDEAFFQVDLYRRNADGTFSRRGSVKPPIAPEDVWTSSIAIDGNAFLVSDPSADDNRGVVFVYGFDNDRGWRLRTTLTADVRQVGARYGERIALDRNRIVVSAPDESEARPEFTGAVYVHEGSGKTWPLQQKLLAIADPLVTGYQFGSDVDISGDRIIVGKYINQYSESVPTHAYIYEKRASWVPVAELNDETYNNFNAGVNIFGDIALASGTDWAYGRPIFGFKLPPLGTLPAP
jgi:hypothetical protein